AGLPAPPPRARAAAWAVAGPVLALLLVLNLAYAAVLTEFLRLDPAADRGPGLTPVTVLLVCVQPAAVEELFFRYAALGVLRRAAGPHAAVAVSAAMFALAHVYAPLSLPYLLLVGVAL